MVDFKKVRERMARDRRGIPIPSDSPIVTQAMEILDKAAARSTAVLETSLHREMRDPDYLASLDRYVDAHA